MQILGFKLPIGAGLYSEAIEIDFISKREFTQGLNVKGVGRVSEIDENTGKMGKLKELPACKCVNYSDTTGIAEFRFNTSPLVTDLPKEFITDSGNKEKSSIELIFTD